MGSKSAVGTQPAPHILLVSYPTSPTVLIPTPVSSLCDYLGVGMSARRLGQSALPHSTEGDSWGQGPLKRRRRRWGRRRGLAGRRGGAGRGKKAQELKERSGKLKNKAGSPAPPLKSPSLTSYR